MSQATRSRPSSPRAWRVFAARDGRCIELQLQQGESPCCPRCGGVLEARPSSRLRRDLPLGASAHDLDCRGCRRFWSMVRHTERSLRIVRMRRFVAALRAVELEPRPGPAQLPAASAAVA
jgi:hypothetical protein